MSDLCPFCNWQTQDILEETRNFCLITDLYPLIEGHSLIIPKTHRRCIGEIPPEEQAEFLALWIYAKSQLEQIYGWVSNWENGGIRQAIKHAHLHLLPIGTQKTMELPAKMWQSGRIVRLDGWSALFEWHKTNGFYQLFQAGGDEPLHILRPSATWTKKKMDEADWVRVRQMGMWNFIKARIIRKNGLQMRQKFKTKWQLESCKGEEQNRASR
ncbi:MAG: HIT family protein [Chloroflexota bacterium]|nr:HIT family protein [Chloroflexota bacterium]